MEWQQGEYSRKLNASFVLPYEFLLCCKLMNIPPRKMLSNFMNIISFNKGSFEEWEKSKRMFINFLSTGTREQSEIQLDQVDIMLQELHSITMLHPREGDSELLDIHEKWKDVYLPYWFNKWSRKIRLTEKSANLPR